MKSRWKAVGSVIAIVGLFLAPACGGSDPDPVNSNVEDAGSDTTTAADTSTTDSATGAGECTVNDDCVAKLPTTTPANCAVATCDTLQKKCHFKAKDSDGDGHAAKACVASTATIETGDDCDDTDPNTYPGAWDGPATDFDAGAGVQSDRCDQKDNDCNGSPDDGKIKVDGGDKTCKCDPNAPLPCYEYANGTPISASTLDNNNNPKGICRKGTRTCVGGVPSACSGAVGPDPAEQCDTLDHDCDGMSGNAGDTVSTATVWYKDGDNDNYGDMNTPAVQQCLAPPGIWKGLIPNTDCDDADPQRNPGLAEVCDGKDNNCNAIADENVTVSYCPDIDSDTYCAAGCVQVCPANAPAGYKPQNTCSAGLDCNDGAGGASIHPGAQELCGDGVDSNCTGGDSETYFNLAQVCTAGNAGVCKRTGVYQCALPARTSTECSVVAGTPTNGSGTISADPAIDMSQVRTDYNPRWDWNCDNSIEVYLPLQVGSFRLSACGSGSEATRFTAACQTITSEAACNTAAFGAKYFNCEYKSTNPVFLFYDVTKVEICGHNYGFINCAWNLGSPGTGCGYINNYTPNAGTVPCR